MPGITSSRFADKAANEELRDKRFSKIGEKGSEVKKYLAIVFLFLSCSHAPKGNRVLDPRVEKFIDLHIENQEVSKRMRADLTDVPFEKFFSLVYTAKIKVDGTPDNSMMLAMLGQYIEKERPPFDSKVIPELEAFEKENRTFMRTMLLNTIKDLKNQSSK